jgi:hypothetical protein
VLAIIIVVEHPGLRPDQRQGVSTREIFGGGWAVVFMAGFDREVERGAESFTGFDSERSRGAESFTRFDRGGARPLDVPTAHR